MPRQDGKTQRMGTRCATYTLVSATLVGNEVEPFLVSSMW